MTVYGKPLIKEVNRGSVKIMLEEQGNHYKVSRITKKTSFVERVLGYEKADALMQTFCDLTAEQLNRNIKLYGNYAGRVKGE